MDGDGKNNFIDAGDLERFNTRWVSAKTKEEMIAEILEHSQAVQTRTSRVWKKEELERLGIEVIDVKWEEV